MLTLNILISCDLMTKVYAFGKMPKVLCVANEITGLNFSPKIKHFMEKNKLLILQVHNNWSADLSLPTALDFPKLSQSLIGRDRIARQAKAPRTQNAVLELQARIS